jgi:hypothetical protein
VSNFKKFLFKRCRRFSPNFRIIGLDVRKLHLLEVEGVELSICSGVHGGISMTKPLEFYFK